MAAQQRRGADRADELVRVGVGQRREPGRVVGEDLGGHAAEPEHHQRAEHVIVGYPDDHLGAARDHRLDQDLALPLAEPLGQRAVGGPHLGLGAQVELDRARVGLVQEPGHVGLEHDRSGRGPEGLDRLVFAAAPVSSTSGMP